ncbi:copper resistance CopC family protein [Streptomyces sp. 35G-GA-8]|uniref:copper resistance CopC family protein n=1 Tax=Streptomyces sp. 35G-GA-8 TaxID=2939434 RepID=UPI00201F4BAC|nr:copper resistance CopC family protein [Streptomyces sp. 35G-GA-8]MCL7379953.1 copper resistance protein CopC [Streptomyces sp. 35G-GA-8]
MPVMNRRAARTVARGAVVPAVAALLWASAPAASAHTELVSGSPAEGDSIGSLPERVQLTFSDPMTPDYAKVAVTGPRGEAVLGDPEVKGEVVSVRLAPASPPGRYQVGYRVVSADGHPVSGSLTFTVKARAAQPPADASPSATAPTEDAVPAEEAVPTEDAVPREPSPEPTARSGEKEPTRGSSARDTAVGAVGAVVVFGAGWVWLHLARRRRARREH